MNYRERATEGVQLCSTMTWDLFLKLNDAHLAMDGMSLTASSEELKKGLAVVDEADVGEDHSGYVAMCIAISHTFKSCAEAATMLGIRDPYLAEKFSWLNSLQPKHGMGGKLTFIHGGK